MILDKNNIDVPEHLNEKFFQEIIEKMLKDKAVKIKKVSFNMASIPGDNYTSQMYQVFMTYETRDCIEKSTSIVIKSMPPVQCTDALVVFDVYTREITAYFKVHRLVKELLPDVKFAAECYHAFQEPFQTIVLEDLKALKFRIVRPEQGLDEVHSRMVLDKLAKYHAATMLFCEKDPEIRSLYNRSHFSSGMLDTELMQNVFYGNMKEATKLVETWPGYENIAKKLRRITDNFNKIVLETVDPTNDTIKVLNHGDLWTANIMFQYESEESCEPKDVVFVDFQIGFVASPAFDLSNLLNASVQLEVLKQKREELLGHYYNSFSATLLKLGLKDIPSKSDFLKEIRRKEMFGVISLCSVAPFMFCDPKDSQNDSLETLADESKLIAKREKMFSSPKVFDALQYGLRRFDELKVLDIP